MNNKSCIEITIPNSIQNDKDTFKFIIDTFYSNILTVENSKVRINFESNSIFDTNILATFGAILSYIKSKNNTGSLSNANKKFVNILKNTGFFKEFFDPSVKELDSNHIIKFKSISSTSKDEFTNYVTDEFLKKCPLIMSKEFLNRLRGNFEEIFQNARMHGNSDNIFVCGQHKNSNLLNNSIINFSIVDIGNTIPYNIKQVENSDSLSDVECILWATEKGNTTKIQNSGGLGLYNLVKFIKFNNGKIQIISGNGFVEISNNEYNTELFDTNFKGTIVNIEVNIDNRVYLSDEELIFSEINKLEVISNIF